MSALVVATDLVTVYKHSGESGDDESLAILKPGEILILLAHHVFCEHVVFTSKGIGYVVMSDNSRWVTISS